MNQEEYKKITRISYPNTAEHDVQTHFTVKI